jgi:hypothetical protein
MQLYRARNPRKSPLWQCAHRHFAEFVAIYPHDYQPRLGPLRPVIPQVVQKFLDCGDLERGFARVRCDHCRHEYLLAFSCKSRWFCPACYQRKSGPPPPCSSPAASPAAATSNADATNRLTPAGLGARSPAMKPLHQWLFPKPPLPGGAKRPLSVSIVRTPLLYLIVRGRLSAHRSRVSAFDSEGRFT